MEFLLEPVHFSQQLRNNRSQQLITFFRRSQTEVSLRQLQRAIIVELKKEGERDEGAEKGGGRDEEEEERPVNPLTLPTASLADIPSLPSPFAQPAQIIYRRR